MKQTQIEWGNSNRPSRVPTLNLWCNGDGDDGGGDDDDIFPLNCSKL